MALPEQLQRRESTVRALPEQSGLYPISCKAMFVLTVRAIPEQLQHWVVWSLKWLSQQTCWGRPGASCLQGCTWPCIASSWWPELCWFWAAHMQARWWCQIQVAVHSASGRLLPACAECNFVLQEFNLEFCCILRCFWYVIWWLSWLKVYSPTNFVWLEYPPVHQSLAIQCLVSTVVTQVCCSTTSSEEAVLFEGYCQGHVVSEYVSWHQINDQKPNCISVANWLWLKMCSVYTILNRVG